MTVATTRRDRARVALGVSLLIGCGRTGLLTAELEPGFGAGGEGGSVADVRDYCGADAECKTDDPCSVAYCAERPDPRTRRMCETRPVSCDDGDACTVDRCDSVARGCVHERLGDKDGDGFVGQAPDGVPASCGGPDCDDQDRNVYPGALELCDSKDNDCNGGIDDGAVYPQATAPVLIAPDKDRSEAVDLVSDGKSYAVSYTFPNSSFHSSAYFERLDGSGMLLAGPTPVSEINADTFGGSIAWSGESYLTTFADARQGGNYEVYVARFDELAQKLAPNLRLTYADSYSLSPAVAFTGSEYVTVWTDYRYVSSQGVHAIMAHRLSARGEAVAEELRLTRQDEDADSAAFAAGKRRLGLVYVASGDYLPDGVERSTVIRFRSYDLMLGDATGAIDLGMDGQDPSITSVGNDFLVTWYTGSERRVWGSALQAAVLDEYGNVLSAGPITGGDTNTRWHSTLTLGNHALVVWAATPSDAEDFQLFYETVSIPDLGIISPRQLLARSGANHPFIEPRTALGPGGDIGVTFNDSTSYLGYFTRLGCQMTLRAMPDTR